ncbi:translesion DNA synthesis-associated protein ImuA [Halomonadaceae bacterium KBTZ08]
MALHTPTQLEQDPRLWRASQHKAAHSRGVPSGFEALDQLLASSGWPLGALIECHCPFNGIGELQLFAHAMRQCTDNGAALFWVDPPHAPYPPGLEGLGLALAHCFMVRTASRADHLWTLEQLLGSSASGMVMGWSRRRDPAALRRLQLALEDSQVLGVMLIPEAGAGQASPAPLRLSVEPVPGENRLQVTLQRQRGGQAGTRTLQLPAITHHQPV